jgi:hypothetical protein
VVNGAELTVIEGVPGGIGTKININDWMVSGNNKVDITILWPDDVTYAPHIASASFKLFSTDRLIKEFKWPQAGTPDVINAYPYTFTETFRADGFPRVSLEMAEKVISSAGVLPRDDQAEIDAIAKQLRSAFIAKDMDTINALMEAKYIDLAVARFTTVAEIKAEAETKYRELMGKTGYSIYFNGRNSFFSAADDKAVKLGQGRIGFPEPGLIVTYREGRTTERWAMDLYFAKINGKWVIIR